MKQERKALLIWIALLLALLLLTLLAAPPAGHLAAEGGLLRRAGPGALAGGLFTLLALLVLVLIRALAVPRFRVMPGRFQLCLEQLTAALSHLPKAKKPFLALGRGLRALALGLAGLPRKLSGIHLARRTKIALLLWLVIAAVPLVLSFLVGHTGHHADVQTAMRDAVLHDVNRVSLFGLKDVNPGLIAAMTVSALLIGFALIVRIFVIPRFREVPGRFQLLLEQAVMTLDGLAGVHEPGRRTFVGAYVFAAGAYIFFGTLFELFGFQAVAANGASVTLPAPLSDVNAAICMGCLSYLVIFAGGVAHNGLHGAKATLKEFSLPISMSFRLFGALLSGLLVTDLVYHYTALSYGVPVIVGVVFTLLHALVQTYVLTMLVGMYYAEVTEKPEREPEHPETPAQQNQLAAG